jgi:hypothetical protein
VNRPALMVLLAVLELVALAYFLLVFWRAEALAAILLRGGYGARGWTQARMASRLRLLGAAGALVALVAVVIASLKVVG